MVGMGQSTRLKRAEIVAALCAAGCVYAEEEAAILDVSAATAQELAHMLARRVEGYPLEHIVGWALFCGLHIAVDPGVFVPRRRSEYLVERALAVLGSYSGGGTLPRILDLCCGSGAVGTAIATALVFDAGAARVMACEVHAADVDRAAVVCATKNLAPFGSHVYWGDLFAPIPALLRTRFDLIVANAPYVPSAAIAFMPPEARIHEPDAALNGGRDGLELHRRIAATAPDWLRPGGSLLLESSLRQAPVSAAILAAHGFSTSIFSSAELAGTVVTGTLP